MKPVLKPFLIAKPEAARIAAGLAMLALLGTSFAAEIQSKGYLSKMGPPGLRFSSPPKPPVLSMGSHPGTYTPPSVFVTEFATATNAIRAIQTNIMSPHSAALNSAAFEPSHNAATNRTKVVERPTESNDLTLQVLVKYFAQKKSNVPPSPLVEPIGFRMPVKDTNAPSSATIQPK